MKTIERIKRARLKIKESHIDTKTNVSNFALALLLGIYTLRSSCSDDKVKGNMVTLAKHQDSLTQAQIRLFQEQGKTALAIIHFDSLLRKTDTILKKQIELLDIQNRHVSLYHKALQQELIDKLSSTLDQYNILADKLSRTQDYTDIYDKERGNLSILMTSTPERLRRIDGLKNIFVEINGFRPFLTKGKLYDSVFICMNQLLAFRSVYVYNINIGFVEDTTVGGRNEFEALMAMVCRTTRKMGVESSYQFDKIKKKRDSLQRDLQNMP